MEVTTSVRALSKIHPCAICGTFDPGWSRLDIELIMEERKGAEIRIKTTMKQLGECEQVSCSACTLLYNSLIRFLSDMKPEKPLVITLRYRTGPFLNTWTSDLPGSSLFRLELGLERTQFDDLEHSFEFFSIENEKPPWRRDSTLPRVPAITSDLDSMHWAKDRFQECLSSHPSCGDGKPAPLPTRLLDIDQAQATVEGVSIHLVESSYQTGIYACLSHCWGDQGSTKRLQTTKATFGEHKHGIPLARFPKTFYDTILFIRGLGIRYVWIDSLCIIQDDPEDWRFEASQMFSVYQNARLTVAATTASNGSRGLYAKVAPEYHGFKVGFFNGRDIYVRKALPHAAITQFVRYRDNEAFPLLDRAWVYQERMLSPRFLHFGPHELVWECLTTSCCPCGEGYQTGTGPLGQGYQPKVRHTTSFHSSAGLEQGWRTLVMEYSRLSLSFPNDRFPALSGLAKQWQAAKQCGYLAGMWRTSLIGDLQWQVETEHRRPKPDTWHGPSWSWASVNSEVTYWRPPLTLLDDVSTILDANCVPKSFSDNTGELASGFLVISALIAEASVQFNGEVNDELIVGGELIKRFLPDYDLRQDCEMNEPKLVYIVKIAEHNNLFTSEGDAEHPSSNEASFLFVLSCLDSDKEIYERIGSCRFSRVHTEEPDNRTFFGQSQERKITII